MDEPAQPPHPGHNTPQSSDAGKPPASPESLHTTPSPWYSHNRIRPANIRLSTADKHRAAIAARHHSPDVRYVQQRLSSHSTTFPRTRLVLSPHLRVLAGVGLLILLVLLLLAQPSLSQKPIALVLRPARVTIELPAHTPTESPGFNQVLPIAQFGTAATRGDIRADPISARVDYTVRGQVAANQPDPRVGEADVQPLLAPALTGLNNRARDALTSYAEQNGLMLEMTTIIPHPEALRAGSGYTLTVSPAVGEPVNPNTLTFSVSVQGSFSALATPPGQPLDEQLTTAVLHHLAHDNRLLPGMQIQVTNWSWDGTLLSVDGVLSPTDDVQSLNEQTQTAIRDAIRGRSRAEAAAALEQFKQHGIIRSYTLPPEREQLPRSDILLDLHVVPAGATSNEPE